MKSDPTKMCPRAALRRRDVLGVIALLTPLHASAADPMLTRWAVREVHGARPWRRIHADEALGLVAVDDAGTLWQVAADRAPRELARGLDPNAPLASGSGQLAARGADGSLWVWQDGRESRSSPSSLQLAPHAGLVVLPAGIIAIDADGHLVRAEPAAGGWTVSARSAEPVLPDARPVQVDLDGRGDGGHIAVLAGPDRERYPHGALGDTVEATRLLWFERHGLRVLRALDVPAPNVLEDITPRPVRLPDGGTGLLTVRSGPSGGQLAVVTADPARDAQLRIAALGAPLGTRNRWMAPTTDGRTLLAVHTPHIGGVLHVYRWEADGTLAGRAVQRDIANHRLGSRELDLSVWLGRGFVAPSQDGTRLRVFDPQAGWSEIAEVRLPAAVVATAALANVTALAALLEDGRIAFTGA
ncbi:MAG: hypothetical protein ABIQ60_13620 [Burkholderiaceae bacterium]